MTGNYTSSSHRNNSKSGYLNNNENFGSRKNCSPDIIAESNSVHLRNHISDKLGNNYSVAGREGPFRGDNNNNFSQKNR
jgi:hypothetical protein